MAAPNAVDPAMHEFYERLIAYGKPRKVALTAVMRKLVALADVLLRADRLWTPKPADCEVAP